MYDVFMIFKHMFSLKKVNRPFGSGEEANNRFLRWPSKRPSWIPDRILAIFDLQVTPMLSIKF